VYVDSFFYKLESFIDQFDPEFVMEIWPVCVPNGTYFCIPVVVCYVEYNLESMRIQRF
jgi:hypothetical protein